MAASVVDLSSVKPSPLAHSSRSPSTSPRVEPLTGGGSTWTPIVSLSHRPLLGIGQPVQPLHDEVPHGLDGEDLVLLRGLAALLVEHGLGPPVAGLEHPRHADDVADGPQGGFE